ncbi:MAG: adenylosuccinate lyase [Chitinophagaceae bacterium]|nr:adenylosuccinate lyase [Chitinophagaceae bacterium]
MILSPLTAVSPIDGRYHSKTEKLSAYFSEYALMKYRLKVEVRYFLFLSHCGFFKIPKTSFSKIFSIADNFSIENAQEIKETEKITNHDVKAVEYFLKKKLKEIQLEKISEWVHFGLTSQDINNTAFPLMWKDALELIYFPQIKGLNDHLKQLAKQWKDVPMLARTHGQPASPTRVGKELEVFCERLGEQIKQLHTIPFTGKFGGATGNFNAHYAAFPKYNWKKFADDFLKNELGLKRQQHTTQIEHYDMLAAHFDGIKRINTILIDLCRDVWTYISMEYFKQKVKKNEVGSSAMPHKVNPIDFENAEGNFGVANAILIHLSSKLPVSRLQRDLTDSTVLRNIGVPVAHTLIAFESLEKGLNKLILNNEKISSDLENNWAVVSEAIQTILRRENYPHPYEALKDLTRGNEHITKEVIHSFIESLNVNDKIKKELKQFSPITYLGK